MRGEPYNQVADDDLQNLRPQASPTRKDSLEDMNQKVTERRADEGAIDGHLGYAGIDVVTMSAPIFRNIGSQRFL